MLRLAGSAPVHAAHDGEEGGWLGRMYVRAARPILATRRSAWRFLLIVPIFQGLAISLLFGLASSTLLTVLEIPAIYNALRDR